MINTNIRKIINQRSFYQQYYIKGINILMGMLILALIFTAIVFYLAIHRSVPAFYASTSDGVLSVMKPLSTPNFSKEALLN